MEDKVLKTSADSNYKQIYLRQCEICLHQDWKEFNHISIPSSFLCFLNKAFIHKTDEDNIVKSTLIHPRIIILCNNCGNTKYINTYATSDLNKEYEENHGRI
jgi:hypothetical protein